jgi:hypothetical protein
VGTSDITRSVAIADARRILGSEHTFSGNEIFMHGLVDHVSGNKYTTEMKSKSLDYRPLEQTELGTRLFLKSVNLIGVPFVIILTGIFVSRNRKRKETAKETTQES